MICWKNMLKLEQNSAAQSLELVKEVLENVALRILCPHEIFPPVSFQQLRVQPLGCGYLSVDNPS